MENKKENNMSQARQAYNEGDYEKAIEEIEVYAANISRWQKNETPL